MEEKQDLISKLVAEKKSLSEENKAQEEMLHKSRLKNIDYDGKLADLNTKKIDWKKKEMISSKKKKPR